MQTYPVEDWLKNIPSTEQYHYRAITVGQFRPPQKDEWYLSGAIPAAYQARANLRTSYHIAKIVRVEKHEYYRIVGTYE